MGLWLAQPFATKIYGRKPGDPLPIGGHILGDLFLLLILLCCAVFYFEHRIWNLVG